jgi:hypothetical protein
VKNNVKLSAEEMESMLTGNPIKTTEGFWPMRRRASFQVYCDDGTHVNSESRLTCRRCGEIGHAWQCCPENM